jgi:hypothetical protein
MPRGTKRIAKIADEAKQRSDAYASGSGFLNSLVLKKGETAKGRFLEEGEGLWYLYTHELPKKPGQTFGDRVLCLDQEGEGKDCPGCSLEGVSRTARVIVNFLRYDEPKLRRDEKGKAVKDQQGNYVFDGVEPQVVVWNAPQSVGGRLAYLEAQNSGGDDSHGLTNHVCTIHRTQDNQNPWMIDVVDRDRPPEPFERKLFESKTEPDKAITQLGRRSIPLMSVGDMRRAFSGVSVASGFSGGDGEASQAQETDNAYARAAAQVATGHINPGAFGG